MKAFVVTLMHLQESVSAAKRCVASGKEYGVTVHYRNAVTKDESLAYRLNSGLKLRKWDTKWSHTAPVVGNFMSQYRLWQTCITLDEQILILEHDAIFTKFIPNLEFDIILSIAIPSFGVFNIAKPGIHKTFSKPGGYLPGAHAYIVKPKGARKLIQTAKEKGILPCDIFLNNKDFPELEELYPGIVRADDRFTTIQKREGCKAKHSYDEDYKILT